MSSPLRNCKNEMDLRHAQHRIDMGTLVGIRCTFGVVLLVGGYWVASDYFAGPEPNKRHGNPVLRRTDPHRIPAHQTTNPVDTTSLSPDQFLKPTPKTRAPKPDFPTNKLGQ
jgi:hypothetical protein